jgi:DNA-binding IclR family transcriptional regulator
LISEPVRKLIAEQIDSVEQLEVLILLREHRSRPWTVDGINERIRSSPNSVRERLEALVQRGLVAQQDAGYRYAAAGELDATVSELARAYAERRFTVIELIFAKPSDKLRAFADAFKVGGARASKKRKE